MPPYTSFADDNIPIYSRIQLPEPAKKLQQLGDAFHVLQIFGSSEETPSEESARILRCQTMTEQEFATFKERYGRMLCGILYNTVHSQLRTSKELLPYPSDGPFAHRLDINETLQFKCDWVEPFAATLLLRLEPAYQLPEMNVGFGIHPCAQGDRNPPAAHVLRMLNQVYRREIRSLTAQLVEAAPYENHGCTLWMTPAYRMDEVVERGRAILLKFSGRAHELGTLFAQDKKAYTARLDELCNA